MYALVSTQNLAEERGFLTKIWLFDVNSAGIVFR